MAQFMGFYATIMDVRFLTKTKNDSIANLLEPAMMN